MNLVSVRNGLRRANLLNRIFHICKYSNSAETSEQERPIKFSTSPAAKHKASLSRQGVRKENNRLSYEPSVIVVSISVLLIYFTFLREENDIDEEFGRNLYSRIAGLEETQLKLSLKYNQEHNLSTKEIQARLREIELEKQSKSLS